MLLILAPSRFHISKLPNQIITEHLVGIRAGREISVMIAIFFSVHVYGGKSMYTYIGLLIRCGFLLAQCIDAQNGTCKFAHCLIKRIIRSKSTLDILYMKLHCAQFRSFLLSTDSSRYKGSEVSQLCEKPRHRL